MKIRVKVQPRSSQQKVVHNKDGSLKVYLKSAPVKGKANKEFCQIIAGFYKVKKSAVTIVAGHTSPNKVVEISK